MRLVRKSVGCGVRLAQVGLAVQMSVGASAESEVMEEVVVVGQRAMLNNAITRQRESDLIESIVMRDAIGQFPDQNVAEAVRRLPGVNVLNDQGEGRFIAVRGLDPSLNGATINGTRIPSPEADTRSVALDVIASELVESIEIKKTLTPDMDADTIGAAIQINTTRAYQRDKGFVTLRAEQSYNDLNGESSPKASIDFLYPVNDRLGVSGGFSFSNRETSTDNIESEGWDITDSGILYADAIEYRDYDVERERVGASFSFDYSASDSTVLYGRVLISLFDDLEERRRLVFEMDEEPSSGDLTSATFLSDDGEISVRRGLKDRFESQRIETYEFGGETAFDNWQVDYKVSLARAEEHEYKTQDPTRFRNDFDGAGDLAVNFDYANLNQPLFSVSTGLAAFDDPATYEVNKIEQVDGRAEDEEIAFQVDVTRQLAMDHGELDIKFGAKVRQREKQFDLYLEVLEDFAGSYTLADVAGVQSYGLTNLGPLPDLSAVRAFNNANLTSFERNQLDTDLESSLEDFSVNEDIIAGYLMGRYESGPLLILGGVRIESTDNQANGNLVELVEEDGVRNGVVLSDDTVFVTARSFTSSYTDWMPSVTLRYETSEDTILRAGVFKSVVRPNFGQLAPRFAIEEADDGEREGVFGNPELDPYTAWNLDVGIEWYFAPEAVVSAGLFHKQIDDFIAVVEFDDSAAPYNGVFNGVTFSEAAIPLNGEEADVTGIELNYQQALANGLLLGFNYTYTDTEATINNRVIPLPAASENNYNAMLGYEKGPVSIRLTAAFRDSYLDELSDHAEEDRYVEEHLQIDLFASYRINDNFKVFTQFVNLNDEPYVAFQRGPGANRLLQYEEYSWTASMGVQANF